jgi:hypothetical protein
MNVGYHAKRKSLNSFNSTKRGGKKMFKKLVLCSVDASLAISLAACGQSDEAICRELAESQVKELGGDIPGVMTKKEMYDEVYKNCLMARKLAK